MQDRIALVLDCAARVWRAPAGDPGLLGWAITIGYGLAAVAAWRVARRAGGRGGDRLGWLLIAVALAALCANKQLDLQVWLTATGRCVARAEGWYGERRGVQTAFVVALAAVLLVVMAALAAWLRRGSVGNVLAVLGFTVLCGFVLLRAISFHHLDRLLHTDVLGLRAHRWAEMGGLGLLLAGAALRLRGAGR